MELLYSCKKCHWDFDRDYIEFTDFLEQYGHFNNIVFQFMNIGYINIHWCLILFGNISVFSVQSFVSLVKFICKHFILLDPIVNKLHSQSSFWIVHY